jgi:hypothetical protein
MDQLAPYVRRREFVEKAELRMLRCEVRMVQNSVKEYVCESRREGKDESRFEVLTCKGN